MLKITSIFWLVQKCGYGVNDRIIQVSEYLICDHLEHRALYSVELSDHSTHLAS